MSEHAAPEDVQQFAGGLQQAHLLCRTYGHNFTPFTVTVAQTEGRPGVYYEQTLRCPRCYAKRRLLLSRSGAVVSSGYIYTEAEGYLAKGIGRIVGEGRDALRLESVVRLIREDDN